MNTVFAVIGGDLRQLEVAKGLKKSGFEVKLAGFDGHDLTSQGLHNSPMFKDALSGAKVVILGLPASSDDITLHAPFSGKPIYIQEVLENLSPGAFLTGGKISEKMWKMCRDYGIYTVDYLEREELTVLNAIPTAEGAIQIAMEEIPITLHGSRVLVAGFGRIGKVLSKMLWGLGVKVDCSARKYEDLAWIKSYGYHAITLQDFEHDAGEYDVIFNTIPEKVFTKERLSLLREDCLIIDLASKPGGVDFESAKELGRRVIWALSLPGKVAAVSAGEIIKETILNIISELGV